MMKLLNKLSTRELNEKAKRIRKEIVDIAIRNSAGHIASSLSCVDILTALYYRILNLCDDPEWIERDRLVFSKAHGCYGVYAILADKGYIRREDWDNFYNGSFLMGCIERSIKHGIEASCGSLGHGLPIATGIALGAKLQKMKYHVYCVVGDGEMQEGSMWEAIQFAVKHKLSNLTIFVDNNGLQAMDFLVNVLTPGNSKDDLQKKLEAFGCEVRNCDGHDIGAITSTVEDLAEKGNMYLKPQVVVANTIKGYGLLCMENVPRFHYRLPNEGEIRMGNRYDQQLL